MITEFSSTIKNDEVKVMDKPLSGKKIAVLVENKFIPEEIEAYSKGFALLGAEVEFISHIWYGDWKPNQQTFYSDVDPLDEAPWESPHQLSVNRDVSTVKPSDYAAVIMSANYTSVRLRWEDVPQSQQPVDARAYVQSPPIVRFFAEAMREPEIVKGALCHGLWILTPHPELLKGRRVTCHTVVMADIINCGAEILFERGEDGKTRVAKVVTDGDLVTGFSKHEVLPFIEAIADQIQGARIAVCADKIFNALQARFDEVPINAVGSPRPVAKAAAKLLDGTLDVAAEVKRMTGVDLDMSRPATHKAILLAASKFGTWASELTLVAGVLVKGGYKVTVATEDGSPPHLLGPSLNPDFTDGAWRRSVVSPEERDLALRFLNPNSSENKLLRKENILDLSQLAKPPQVGDYLRDHTLLNEYREDLKKTVGLANEYDGLIVAGGSGAIPGFMFDRGLQSLILAFHHLRKPVMAECNGGLAVAQTVDPNTGKSILDGRAVTTHSWLDEYQSSWGWTQAFSRDTQGFCTRGTFDLGAYSTAEQWIAPGTGGNPLIDSEGLFKNAAGKDGVFFSPPGSPYSVVVDGNLITCRTTPDGYPGVLALMAVMDGRPPLRGRLYIDADEQGRDRP
jgi:protease I